MELLFKDFKAALYSEEQGQDQELYKSNAADKNFKVYDGKYNQV